MRHQALNDPSPSRRLLASIFGVFVLALVAGGPSIRGGFLSGDDYHLVRNHVLVNHPSWSHALELLTIVHRDLYQPLPLLSFSLDFAILGALGLEPTEVGPHPGAWVFHLTNILLHAGNAVLVFFVVRRLAQGPSPGDGQANARLEGFGADSWRSCRSRVPLPVPPGEALRGRRRCATPGRGSDGVARSGTDSAARDLVGTPLAIPVLAAGLFAIHPLAAECISWLNGRMMMLSTLFTLATVLAFERWDSRRDRGRDAQAGLESRTDARPSNRWRSVGRAAWVFVFAFLAHASKISVALPVLVAIVPLARRRRLDRAWWWLWSALTVVTVAFAFYNLRASGEMFEIAEGEMPGSPVLHVLLALGQYFRQFVGPFDLSVWYPPPLDTSWRQPAVVGATAVIGIVLAILVWTIRRTRVVVLGLVWFLTAVGPTLPIVPARRAIAADRYAYLPMIGLTWIAATGAVVGWRRGKSRRGRQAVMGGAAAVVAVSFIATSWRTQGYHRDNIAAAERNAETNPDFPGVHESTAWAYYRANRFDDAIAVARKDLEKHPEKMACKVHQVVGMSLFRLGRHEEAVRSLHRAIAVDPNYGKCYSRLAYIQTHLGQHEQAIAHYEKALEIMPTYIPGIVPLAELYRRVGRTDDAVRTYERALTLNAYEVPALLALAEIDLERRQFDSAIARLSELLEWMPENTTARTNLGLAYEGRGGLEHAVAAYREAIRGDPRAVIATVNLGNVYLRLNRPQLGWELYQQQLPRNPTRLTLLVGFHDLASGVDRMEFTVGAFLQAHRLAPDDPALRTWTAYSLAQARRYDEAAGLLGGEVSDGDDAASRSPFRFQAPDADPDGLALDRTEGASRDAEAEGAHASRSEIAALARILVALARDQSETALAEQGALLDPKAVDARNRLVADLERFSLAHPASPWPYLLTARVLIVQNKADFARLALAEFTRLCPTPECRGRANEVVVGESAETPED